MKDPPKVTPDESVEAMAGEKKIYVKPSIDEGVQLPTATASIGTPGIVSAGN